MDFNKTVDLIIKDLAEAREIIDDLKNYEGVPAIQIELAKAKIKNAAEVIALFKNLTSDARSLTPLTKEMKTEVAEKNVTESGIVADRFNDFPDSLNKKLGSMRDDDDIPDYLKAKPLSDLKQAIGVNDRFLFIRELFNGDSDSYNQAISKIDEANNLSDAKAVMINYTGDKSESDAGKQLFDLLKRKFPGDE
ncbi:MAG: hypothetical protein MUF36_06545 [Bacteroidales bacterium]|jgi:hypothetical protein|nr:hypothetical protein [Bacteroidales bacterium]